MGAATIDVEPVAATAGPEVYALSMDTLRRLGWLACEGGTHEAAIAAGMAYADFFAGAAENLKTDRELSHLLDVARTYDFNLKDGHAVSADGTPMVDIVRRGYEQTMAEAAKDPRKAVQAERDKGDMLVAETVDTLRPGEVYAVLSMCPEDAFAQGIDMASLGYVPGMSFVQVFANVGNKITVHCLSVEASTKQAWHDVLLQYGADISAATPANEWIQHGVRASMPTEHALGLAARIRESYYARVAQTQRRYSVNDFLEHHGALVRSYFDQYVRPLADALYTHQNNDVMQGLAQALLGADVMSSIDDEEMARELARVAHNEPDFDFTAAAGRTMERLIRYALVEDLRARLVGGIPEAADTAWPYAAQQARDTVHHAAYAAGAAMHAHLARHIQAGVQAKRSYDGCSGLRFVKGADEESDQTLGSPQEPYGGKGKGNERDEKSGEACDYWIDGCYCSPYDDDGSRRDPRPPVRVKVKREADGRAHCLRPGCGACLGPNGECLDIGGIARRARRQKPAATKKTGALAVAA